MSVNSEFSYNISKLAEESGELVQVAMKIQIFGVDSINPDTGASNRDALKKEIGDVLVSSQLILEALGMEITPEFIEQRREQLKRYYLMSQMV